MNRPLGPLSLRVVRVFAEACFDDGTPGLPARLDWLMGDYADFTQSIGTKSRIGFAAAAFAVQWLPLFFVGRPLPMTWLAPETRRRYLEKLEASALTFLITALKLPLSMVYFEHPDVMARTGYDGRPLVELPNDAVNGLPATARKARLAVLPPAPGKAVSR